MRRVLMGRAVLPLLAFSAVAFVPVTRASADAGTPLYGLRPALAGQTTLSHGHFRYDLRVGGQASDAVEAFNFSTAQLTLAMYPTGVFSTGNGGLAPMQPGEARTGVAKWLKLRYASVTLLPQGHALDPFRVRVPKGTPPGDYFGAVVGALEGGPVQPNGLITQTRVALVVQVHVLGHGQVAITVHRVALQRHGDTERFSVSVVNRGNLLTTVAGHVELRGLGVHHAVALGPPGMYLIPGGRATLHGEWHGLPTVARAHARAVVTALVDERTVATFRGPATLLLFFPWVPAGLGLLLVVAVAVAFITNRRRMAAWRVRRADERRVVAAYRESRREGAGHVLNLAD